MKNEEISDFKPAVNIPPSQFFSSDEERQFTWYFGHCSAYCTIPGLWIIMSMEQSVE
jgi:hypothetical protein